MDSAINSFYFPSLLHKDKEIHYEVDLNHPGIVYWYYKNKTKNEKEYAEALGLATYLAIKQNQSELLSNVNVLCEITQKAADIFSGRSILEELLSDLLRPSYNGEFMPQLPFEEPKGGGIPGIPMPVIPIPVPFLF